MSAPEQKFTGEDLGIEQRSSVEITKSAAGKYHWRVKVYAADGSAMAVEQARDLALAIETTVAVKYGEQA